MSQQTINVGAAPNDGTGTPLRTAFQYCNSNFSELYTATGPSGNNIVVPGNATITGDLTVRTNKLAVTSSGVGFGTTSPSAPIQVGDTTGSPEIRMSGASTAAAGPYLTFYKGGTRKTLIGNEAVLIGSGTSDALMFYTEGGNGIKWNIGSSTPSMTLDSSGNLGLGVTPSAGGSNYYKTFELGKAGCGLFVATNSLTSSELTYLSGNGVLKYNASPEWSYGNAGSAAIYGIEEGVHKWYNAGSGSAGGVFVPTQAMTLDASGNLLVGKTAVSDTTVGSQILPSGIFTSTRSASTDGTGTTMVVYSTGASAYRFYVGMGGTVYATNTTISAISDARLKENVQDIDVGLDAILALKPRKFDWKAGKGKDIKGDRGFIAQEFETVFPNLIDEWKDPAPEGEAPYKSVRQDLIPVLVKAVQELAAEVNALKNK